MATVQSLHDDNNMWAYFQDLVKVWQQDNTRADMAKAIDDNEENPPPPKPKGDQITNVIGDLGRWHFEKILLVFLASAPGDTIFNNILLTWLTNLSQVWLTFFMLGSSPQNRSSGVLR